MDMEQLYNYVPRELVTFILVTLFSLLIGLSQRRISLKREGETTLFGTGHRVSSDKVILQSQPDDLVMDRSFDTSDVSQDHIIMQVRHHLL